MIGQRIGNYRVRRQLGEGGMGRVYEAVQEQLGRRVAIKVLRPELSQNRDFAARFFNEARAVNIIGHPGILNVFEYGQLDDGAAYLVMEYLDGESLAARLHRRSSAIVDLLRIGRQVAAALGAAHQKGIIHRDLKPDNVMIVPDPEAPGGERAKVLDFGIAKVAEEHGFGGQQTRTGVLMGTPLYMAPEQCRGAGRAAAPADVYALGVILYQILSGQPPFLADGPGEIMAMHIFSAPRPLAEVSPGLPEELVQVVDAMLRKAPTDRPTMDQVAAELERIISGLAGSPLMATVRSAPPAWSGPGSSAQRLSPPPSTLGSPPDSRAPA